MFLLVDFKPFKNIGFKPFKNIGFKPFKNIGFKPKTISFSSSDLSRPILEKDNLLKICIFCLVLSY